MNQKFDLSMRQADRSVVVQAEDMERMQQEEALTGKPVLDQMIEEVQRRRFAMQPEAVVAFRQAAAIAVRRLLDLVKDDAKFNRMSTKDKLKVLDMIFDRAYGKSETASMASMTEFRTGQDEGAKDRQIHAAQISDIEQRMRANRRALPDARAQEVFPELRKKQRATRLSSATTPAADASVGVVVDHPAKSSVTGL